MMIPRSSRPLAFFLSFSLITMNPMSPPTQARTMGSSHQAPEVGCFSGITAVAVREAGGAATGATAGRGWAAVLAAAGCARRFPQLSQKTLPGGLVVPQLEHRNPVLLLGAAARGAWSGLPQAAQNLALFGLSV